MDTGASRPRAAVYLITFFSLFALLTVAGFAYGWRLEVASEEGVGIDSTITYLMVVTGLIVLVGHAVLCWFIWNSTAGVAAAHGRPSRRAEWMWSLIPVLIMTVLSEAGVLFVGGPVWDSLYVEQPDNPIELQIAGKQFEWYIHYPGKDKTFGKVDLRLVDEQENLMGLDEDEPAALDDIVKRDTIYVPVDRPVVLRLMSYDVIHSFFVPEFRVKQDLLPGFPTRIKFTPTREGVFELACAELCGLGHYTMRGEVHVVSAEEYEAWLAKQFTFGG